MKEATLLIVDDDPVFLESISTALKEEFSIRKAPSGIEALKIIDSADLSLIILDLQMPGMDGVKLLKKIRNNDIDIPVIVLTGYSSHEMAIKCADLNVQGYMEKPIEINKLILKIRKILNVGNSKLLREIFGDNYKEKIWSFSPKVRKVINYLHSNYKKNIKREELGSYFRISPGHLSRQFHRECGIQLKDFANLLKVQKCKEYLAGSDKKASEIALLVGISDVNYLSRIFKRYTGTSPLDFRKNILFKSS